MNIGEPSVKKSAQGIISLSVSEANCFRRLWLLPVPFGCKVKRV